MERERERERAREVADADDSGRQLTAADGTDF
jgi:hypothetical protein